MAQIYSMLAKKMITVPDRKPAAKGPDVIVDGDPLKMAVQCNGYLLESLQEVTKKLEQATAALTKAEARAAAAESKHEGMEKAGQTELMKTVTALNSTVSGLQASMGKLAGDVQAIRDKPAPVQVPTVQQPKINMPAPVVDMAAIASTIRAEIASMQPASPGPVQTTVVERDANGYVKTFITKPLN